MSGNKEKKGFSKFKLILIIVLIVLVIMGILYFRMKWKQFQASANFGIWMFVIIVSAFTLLYFKLRHDFKKKKEAEEAAEAEEE